jgi:hypothetical protein
MLTIQAPAPEHAPDQPVNVEPESAAGVKVTLVPGLYVSLQSEPQLIPAGLLVTVPLPVPDFVTVRVYCCCCCSVNVAVTVLSLVMDTVQAPAPEQAPDHPVNVDPESGVGVNLTLIPWLNSSLQSAPQLIPAGLLATVPLPVPVFVTVKVYCCRVNVAVTVLSLVMDTVQAPAPEHAPDHPVNVEPESGVEVKITLVPWLYA